MKNLILLLTLSLTVACQIEVKNDQEEEIVKIDVTKRPLVCPVGTVRIGEKCETRACLQTQVRELNCDLDDFPNAIKVTRVEECNATGSTWRELKTCSIDQCKEGYELENHECVRLEQTSAAVTIDKSRSWNDYQSYIMAYPTGYSLRFSSLNFPHDVNNYAQKECDRGEWELQFFLCSNVPEKDYYCSVAAREATFTANEPVVKVQFRYCKEGLFQNFLSRGYYSSSNDIAYESFQVEKLSKYENEELLINGLNFDLYKSDTDESLNLNFTLKGNMNYSHFCRQGEESISSCQSSDPGSLFSVVKRTCDQNGKFKYGQCLVKKCLSGYELIGGSCLKMN